MGPLGLTRKEIKKTNKELIDIHRSLLEGHIKNIPKVTLKQKTQIIRLYDNRITEANIRMFYNRKIKLFFYALLTDRLEEIKQYNTLWE